MKTRNNNKIITLLIATLLVLSCTDDFIEATPTTFVTPDALLVDEKGAETYLTGVYDAVQNRITAGGQGETGWSIHWGTMAADEVVVPGWEKDLKLEFLHQLTPTVGSVRNLWAGLYEGINSANSAIDRISAMTPEQIDNDVKANFVGQARFLRATMYFSLVVTYENIPLIKNETVGLDNVEVPQSSPEEVYEFIIADLKAAEAVLAEEQGNGRATKGAAQALLGKVYLQMTGFPLNQTDKFALAETKLKEVMDSGVYDLLEVYSHVFDLDHEQSNEMIFSVGMEGPSLNEGGLLSTFYGPSGNVNNGGGWGTCYINQEHESSYDRGDSRLINNVASHNANNTSPEEAVAVDPNTWGANKVSWRGWKWHAAKPNGYANDTPFDNPYLRYADVLLMYAEALNGQNKLTQGDLDITVNRLRARARVTPEAVPPMTIGTVEENATELLSERRKELCFEGWRRNDLIRFGKYKETILAIDQGGWSTAGNPGPNYEDHEIRWPIPNSEIQINPALVQNPGY